MIPAFPGAFLEQSRRRRRRRSSARVESLFPKALPCPKYYDLFPEEVGAVGNAVLTNAHELIALLPVARPVSIEYAELHGGCVCLGAVGDAPPQYLCITDSDDEVYGRARYLPRPAAVAVPRTPGSLSSGERNVGEMESARSPRRGDVRACSGVRVRGCSRGQRKAEAPRIWDRAPRTGTTPA